jgi:hypothetical protein
MAVNPAGYGTLSVEAETGSAQEIATEQKTRSSGLMQSDRETL